MSGRARSPLARLVARFALALVAFVSAPVAARAQPLPEHPGAQPAPPPTSPGATALSPGATAPSLRVPDESARRIYEASRRSQGVALVVELFMPGFGSIYGDHWQGAAITWSMNVTGSVATAWGAWQLGFGESDSSDLPQAAMLAGLGLMVASRVHGLIDAYRSTARYNRRLARRFGLVGRMVLAPMPLQTSGQAALGLGASWQF
jgi:hypothetical protein